MIFANALFYILRDASLGHPIKGITLPNEDELINAQFANHTTLFFNLSKDNFSMAIHVIKFICFVSGAKVSPHKFVVIGGGRKLLLFGYLSWGGTGLNLKLLLGIWLFLSPKSLLL